MSIGSSGCSSGVIGHTIASPCAAASMRTVFVAYVPFPSSSTGEPSAAMTGAGRPSAGALPEHLVAFEPGDLALEIEAASAGGRANRNAGRFRPCDRCGVEHCASASELFQDAVGGHAAQLRGLRRHGDDDVPSFERTLITRDFLQRLHEIARLRRSGSVSRLAQRLPGVRTSGLRPVGHGRNEAPTRRRAPTGRTWRSMFREWIRLDAFPREIVWEDRAGREARERVNPRKG